MSIPIRVSSLCFTLQYKRTFTLGNNSPIDILELRIDRKAVIRSTGLSSQSLERNKYYAGVAYNTHYPCKLTVLYFLYCISCTILYCTVLYCTVPVHGLY